MSEGLRPKVVPIKARKLLLYKGWSTSSPHVSKYLSGSKLVEPSVWGLFGMLGMIVDVVVQVTGD